MDVSSNVSREQVRNEDRRHRAVIGAQRVLGDHGPPKVRLGDFRVLEGVWKGSHAESVEMPVLLFFLSFFLSYCVLCPRYPGRLRLL